MKFIIVASYMQHNTLFSLNLGYYTTY